MFSPPVIINNHLYHDTSSSSSSSCSSLDSSHEEFILLNNKSSLEQHRSMPDNNKDPRYYSQQSRVKNRGKDLILETKLIQLANQNEILRAKIDMLTRKFNQKN
ncbi:unnamed protein product [Adineta steineri]|uniref:BZIP domain-containing protein n=1 Tax=Adineta steineri TaxID=433720 RepID=A0A819C2B7_9BILA|nr:unnamed protein product [Adineta steineri]CAF3800850.1 unnamed protein product [Adineta steineri]